MFPVLRSFVTNNDIPVGYVTPKFPSLYWPINNSKYSTGFLYYISDIWKFSLYWTLIFNGAFYVTAGVYASLTHRKKAGSVWIFVMYVLYGGLQGLTTGTVMGFLIGAIYRSGLFSMSTWVPLCCAVVQILFDVVLSYSMVGSVM
ncbi:CPA_1a_G0057280.mRNA.1.CDS.1 [Saccharomyces cerevisiae]|nr:CPA_1a_G0057280.mRNA.1.CDS.1 [Saccharomyces cerevisiae]CAI7489740.1 CPA_1a_G0057280.mRNA.1.CDS.1 [Saccharomyces cerevisiae]